MAQGIVPTSSFSLHFPEDRSRIAAPHDCIHDHDAFAARFLVLSRVYCISDIVHAYTVTDYCAVAMCGF